MDEHDKTTALGQSLRGLQITMSMLNRRIRRTADELMVLGYITLAIWALISVAWIQHGGWVQLLWLCDVATFLTAVGLIFRSRIILTAQLVGMVIYHLAWHVDTLSYVFLGSMPFSSTAYMFSGDMTSYEKALSFFQHTFLVPVAAWAVWRLGASRLGWVFQSLQTMAAFLVTYSVTEHSANINWIFGAGFADLSPAKINPIGYYIAMTICPALLIYLPANIFLNRLVPCESQAIDLRTTRIQRIVLACAFTILIGTISIWVGHACEVKAEVPQTLLEVPARGPLALERIPQGHDAPRVSAASYGSLGEEVQIPLLAMNRNIPRLRYPNKLYGTVCLSELLRSYNISNIPSAPQEIVIRGQRGRIGTVLVAIVVSDKPYLQSYLDLQTALSRFELHCRLGREGLGEFVVKNQSKQDPSDNHVPFGNGVAGIYAVTVVALKDQIPVGRSPFYLFKRTGVYRPEDIDWSHNKISTDIQARQKSPDEHN